VISVTAGQKQVARSAADGHTVTGRRGWEISDDEIGVA
jgi:hypothetical protein